MAPKFSGISTCCFCISLRAVTLTLAFLGLVGNLLVAYVSLVQPNSSIVYGRLFQAGLSGVICAAGLYGVWKNKVKMIRLFATYIWFNLVLGMINVIVGSVLVFQNEDFICNEVYNNMDVDICHEYYFKIALTSVAISSLIIAIDTYAAIAVWSYYRQVASHSDYSLIEQEPEQYSEKKSTPQV
ncbi:hypothetical protein K493DRAFT_298670 [Basidiobolus meristosporus CBS 931.73]|uniref:Uncharacterized protein n=1 Tax=Basidiobolus meristosporus CBS 931.73 TaxID=1314790 RepID=A0A1Y1YSY3_9FUNG|nr:hypothetical protein K493DRAFT_298670 [Basidiobolus meristosporus CBS 931.73]|eukprot:ORY00857.1 hypothetical protein K493DRAFT_298670 [Basidiobolus meristosporus CBS 931.73]